MRKLVKEELEKLKIDTETCIQLVKELSADYDSKKHYELLTQSVISSVNSTINSITHSNGYLDGYYVMCDELDPRTLAEYLLELRDYNVDKDVLTYYIAYYLKRKINNFYRNLKNGILPMGVSMIKDKAGFKKYRNIFNDRAINGLKLLRSKK